MVGLRNSSASHLRLVPTLSVEHEDVVSDNDGAAVTDNSFVRSLRGARRSIPVSYEILIRLDEVSTQISRRIVVDSNFALDDLHTKVQHAMGWQDLHGHSWRKAGTRFPGDFEEYLPADRVADRRRAGQVAIEEDRIHLDEVLASPGDKIQYRYGRAGSWRHTLILESVSDDASDTAVVCIDGVGACPPEACVGPDEYEQLLGVLVSEELRSREWTLEWAQTDFEPERFVLSEVNDRLSSRVGTVAHRAPVRAFPLSFDIWRLFELLGPASSPELHDVFDAAGLDDRDEFSSEIRFAAGARLRMLLTLIGDEGIDFGSFCSTVDTVLDQPEFEHANLPKGARLFTLLRMWGMARKFKGRLVLTRRGFAARENSDVLWDCIVQEIPVVPDGAQRAVELLVLLAVAAGLEPADRHHLVSGSLSQIRGSRVLASEFLIPAKFVGTTVEALELIGAIGYDLVNIGSQPDAPWASYLARAVLQR